MKPLMSALNLTPTSTALRSGWVGVPGVGASGQMLHGQTGWLTVTDVAVVALLVGGSGLPLASTFVVPASMLPLSSTDTSTPPIRPPPESLALTVTVAGVPLGRLVEEVGDVTCEVGGSTSID